MTFPESLSVTATLALAVPDPRNANVVSLVMKSESIRVSSVIPSITTFPLMVLLCSKEYSVL